VPVTESPTRGRATASGAGGLDVDQQRAGAAAAILGRLWGAFGREPVPGLTHRRIEGGRLTLGVGGTDLTGDAASARAFAVPADGFAITVTVPGGRPRQVSEPGELVRTLAAALGPHAPRLAAELDDSVANLALARAAQGAPDGGAPMLDRAAAQPDPLVFLEQSVVDGHPLHPCARTRMGLSPEQVRRYAPEHRPDPVMLREVAIPAGRWFAVDAPPRLLMHPYQHDLLRDRYPFLSTVEQEVPAHPLMSLRTLALAGDPTTHVKTAVDIQMTSAVRTVSPVSILNGQTLSRLLLDPRLRVSGLEVLTETGGGAVIVDRVPDRHLAMVRRAVAPLPAGEIAFPLAALAAPSLATGAALATEMIQRGYGGDPLRFVEALATVLLPPVFALMERGVALEAHGQNLLGIVRGHRLVGLRYRDFGGVRVSPRRIFEHGLGDAPLRGDVPAFDPEVLRTKVLASAVSTVLSQVIALVEREDAWSRVAAVARRIEGPDAPYLFADTLPVKATTAMRLAERPIDDIWCTVPNPMAGLG
jgi:siderophore synthetase component